MSKDGEELKIIDHICAITCQDDGAEVVTWSWVSKISQNLSVQQILKDSGIDFFEKAEWL